MRARSFLLLIAFCGLASPCWAQEPVPRVDGYRGIWFTLGQFYGKGEGDAPYSPASNKPVFPYGDKYSGGLGTYTAKHTPLAIHVPEVRKTFFVYGGAPTDGERRLLCMIGYVDHQTLHVPRPVIVHDKGSVDDPHDNPSLAMDADGHLWVFVSGRGRHRPGFKYRSREPYAIDAGFERITEEEMTYPQPYHLPSKRWLHFFTKYTGVRELYWETSTDGREWSADHQLAAIRESGHAKGGHYQTSAIDGERVGTFFNRHPNGVVDQRTDLYYLETRDGGETWTTVDGVGVVPPVKTVEHASRVHDYAREGLLVYLKDMAFDDHGRPVLLYVTSQGHEPGPPNAPRHFRFMRWDGAQWQSHLIAPTDHNYDMGSLKREDGGWSVIIPTDPGPQPHHGGGEMVLWRSENDGGGWERIRALTRSSVRNHNYARRPQGAVPPFEVFWADGDPSALSASRLYVATADGGQVLKLPPVIDGDTAPLLPMRPPQE